MTALIHVCDACGNRVHTDGYICADAPSIERRRNQVAAWHRANPGRTRSTANNYPPLIAWRTYHAECDPRGDNRNHGFLTSRCRTERDLLALAATIWNRHFTRHTDFPGFIRRTLAANAELAAAAAEVGL